MMNFRKLDSGFATSGQISPGDVKAVVDAGFKSILCARPDNEDPGQPSFSEISREAARHGLKTVHIPISGGVTSQAARQMAAALGELPGPMLGYCRSGARAGNLYAMARRAGQ